MMGPSASDAAAASVDTDTLATQLGLVLAARGLRLVTAESCTGGLIAGACTSVAGSSDWFERGYVTYSNEAKTELLGVPAEMIARHGAVSREVAMGMAMGALQHARAQVAVSVTGIAGPGGGSEAKPVGTVWFGFGRGDAPVSAECVRFKGDRREVRSGAVRHALARLLAIVSSD
ncbi:CinA family protein [Caldimonas brevitalea]|uniref:Damage-inducible protein CinA n=1 Tax=Caldimonas brevitalea TaxID=413882 RepID=A0A0G3BC77_9BURK|nr:CinA family protein [Caldimonas brevitalea]AKJ26969.1 damage-inducible protein CinA [Caldimonas brevitalea]